MDGELSQDLILQSLLNSFSQFVVNFHMNKLDISLSDMLNMLKTVESHFPTKKDQVLLIGESSKKGRRPKDLLKRRKIHRRQKERQRLRIIRIILMRIAKEFASTAISLDTGKKLQGVSCRG